MDRTLIVTGGTRGLGAAVARAFAGAGGQVAAVYRNDDEQADRFLADAAQAGSVSVHRADLAQVEECRRVVGEVRKRHGPVLHLVNNAALLREGRVLDVTEQMWDTVLDANLKAAFFMSQAVWGDMVENRYGRIVNIGSVTATSGNPVEAAYGASKAGLTGLTRSLAMAGARKGITANVVVPGVYETDMTAGMSEADQERIARLIPVGRRGQPHELAHVVNALLDESASYVTGSVLMVDGGLGMGA